MSEQKASVKQEPVRVHKFLPCSYGLLALLEQRLKITRYADLNDPFDMLPFDLSNPTERAQAETVIKNAMTSKLGLLCFSQTFFSPALWAHYADGHKGLCLAFDVTPWLSEACQSVTYISAPMKLKISPGGDDPYLPVAETVFTKFKHWEYEAEYRTIVSLGDKAADGLYYKQFGGDLQLREVIIGSESPISAATIRKAIGPNAGSITVMRAKPAHDRFEIIAEPVP